MKTRLLAALILSVSGCSLWDGAETPSPGDFNAALNAPQNIRKLPASQREAAQLRQGSLKDLVFAPGADEAPQRNLYLWNAALDVLARFPLKTVDGKNGLLVTETIKTAPNEDHQITVRVDGGRLTPRLLTVGVVKRVDGIVTSPDPTLAAQIKAQIIARAQELRAQRQTGQ